MKDQDDSITPLISFACSMKPKSSRNERRPVRSNDFLRPNDLTLPSLAVDFSDDLLSLVVLDVLASKVNAPVSLERA